MDVRQRGHNIPPLNLTINQINPAQVTTTYFYINFNRIPPVSAYVYEVVPSVLLPQILYTYLISPMTLRGFDYANQNGIKSIIYELSHRLYCSGNFSSLGTYTYSPIASRSPSPFVFDVWHSISEAAMPYLC
jgi:hypothetical protein